LTRSSTNTSSIKKTVAPTISAADAHPMLASSLRRVLVPSAATAATKHHRKTSELNLTGCWDDIEARINDHRK
jgi:hypothetical protein